MTNARQPERTTIRRDPTFENQVSTINIDSNAVAEEGYNPVSRHN
jgi:hypothetical protein